LEEKQRKKKQRKNEGLKQREGKVEMGE